MQFIKIVVLMAAIALPGCTMAQTIPNGGFESWAIPAGGSEIPVHWVTNDMLTRKFNPAYKGVSVSKTDESHLGSYAVKLGVAISGRDTINGGIYSTGSIDSLMKVIYRKAAAGFRCNVRITNFKGFYIFNSVRGDTAIFGIDLTKWNKQTHKRDTLVNTTLKIGQNASSYSPFTIPLNYRIAEAPDTAFITIGIKGPKKNAGHPGTLLIIDDLSFSGTLPVKK